MESKTGILFFARRPEAEAQAKNWTPSKRKNIQLAQALYNHTRAILNDSGLPIFFSDNLQQKGQGFNNKITNALTAFFSEGFEEAIIIGSDCPDLSLSDIQKAADNSRKNISTVGASPDGGVYLFTISKKDFDADSLAELPWCSPRLKHNLIAILEEQNREGIEELKVKADFDSRTLSERHLLNFVNRAFRKLIFAILSFPEGIFKQSFALIGRQIKILTLRGPPAQLSA